MYIRTEPCHHEGQWSEELSFSTDLQGWDIQSHYKRQVLAHIISAYSINDGKSCSCVMWELKGKHSWSRSLSVSRALVFQRAILSQGHFCPHWRAEGSSGWDVLWCGPRHRGRGKTLVPTQQQRPGTAWSHCTSVLLLLFQHVFMPLHRLTVAHLYPAVLLYSREFMLWIYGWIMSLFKLPHRTKQLYNTWSSQHSCTGSRLE